MKPHENDILRGWRGTPEVHLCQKRQKSLKESNLNDHLCEVILIRFPKHYEDLGFKNSFLYSFPLKSLSYCQLVRGGGANVTNQEKFQ